MLPELQIHANPGLGNSLLGRIGGNSLLGRIRIHMAGLHTTAIPLEPPLRPPSASPLGGNFGK